MTDKQLSRGVYRHYKDHYYLVLGEARHSETNEVLVVYQALYGECGWWVRPKAMFLENVVVQDETRPRFVFVGETIPNP